MTEKQSFKYCHSCGEPLSSTPLAPSREPRHDTGEIDLDDLDSDHRAMLELVTSVVFPAARAEEVRAQVNPWRASPRRRRAR